MKRPVVPPPLEDLLEKYRERLPAVLSSGAQPTVDGHYIHWDKLRRKEKSRPAGLSAAEWWTGVRLARFGQSRPLPLRDTRGRPFSYMLPDRVQAALHRIDSGAGGRIGIAETVTNPATRDRFIVDSLIREAITSSQLEGASTTRGVAAKMIRSGRRPRNRSERMILNNYRAMRDVREMKEQPLTAGAVLALHRAVTDRTLDDPDAAGRLQLPGEERVEVCDAGGNVLHRPPPAEELPERFDEMVRFANAEDGTSATDRSGFLHPVVRAILLHFWLAHDHPFADGNGRTARALFYWAMLRRGYWMFEFLSISRFLKAAPQQYARAFLHAETDGSDATYFLVHQADVILRALDDLDSHLQLKAAQAARIDRMLRNRTDLNHRQLALLAHAVRHPDSEYTTRSHMTSHNVVYATARADLFRLADLGLLDRNRRGRKLNVFLTPPDLEKRIRTLGARPVRLGPGPSR